MRLAVRGALVVIVSLLGACTSNDGTTASGSGGSSSSGCTPGATQTCVKPTCSGAQTCQSDHTWGACDCGGGSGGSGGGAGWPGSGGSGGGSGASGGAAGSTGATGGGGGSAGVGTGGTGGTGGTAGAGTGGTGTGGGAGAPTSLDLHDATIYDNPQDLADWPVGTTITEVDFQYNGADGVRVLFDKRDGANRWPDVTPPGWTGPLEYTLGMAEYINGHWYASAAIQFWNGLDASGGNVAANNQVATNWYYDSRWGELAGRQPATGELIGIFVVAGNLRGVTDGSQSPVMERSNVVVVPMPDVNGATYTF